MHSSEEKNLGHIEPAREERLPSFTGVAHKDNGLAVVYFAGRAAILSGNSYRPLALLDKLATVHIDHGLGIGDQGLE
jgi:hypothetical protein